MNDVGVGESTKVEPVVAKPVHFPQHQNPYVYYFYSGAQNHPHLPGAPNSMCHDNGFGQGSVFPAPVNRQVIPPISSSSTRPGGTVPSLFALPAPTYNFHWNNSNDLNQHTDPPHPVAIGPPGAIGSQYYATQTQKAPSSTKTHTLQNNAADEAAAKDQDCSIQKAQTLAKNTRKRRQRIVQDVARWEIPANAKDKHAVICQFVKKGIAPTVLDKQEEKRNALHHNPPKLRGSKIPNKKRKRIHFHCDDEMVAAGKKMIHPHITGVEFDKRFLCYELSQSGRISKEKLIRTFSVAAIPFANRNQAKQAWEMNHVEEIPDDPSRTTTSSRIGSRYQAQVHSEMENEKYVPATDTLLPGYDALWDPKLAREAERRGEDISGFLEGNHELNKQELLLSILHKNKYCVKSARIDYEKICREKPRWSSSKLTRDESDQFDILIHESQKNFRNISKSLDRKVSDCLIHYYGWKRSNPSYAMVKRTWKNQWCSVCDDGGELLVCDGCNQSFHLGCATPPLTTVPEGQWFCQNCQEKKQIGLSVLSPICGGRRRSSVTSISSSYWNA